MNNYLKDYKNLELDEDCTISEIKQAYKRLAKKYHPDKLSNNNSNNINYDKFIEISESYNRLINLNNIIDDDSNDNIEINFYLNIYIKIIKNLYEYIKNNYIKKEKNKEIIVNLDITILEIYNNDIKKLTIKVLRKEDNNLVLKKEDIFISLLNYKTEYIFENKGDDSLTKERGDIKVIINIVKDKFFKILNNDIIYNLNISLYDFYFEKNIQLIYFNNEIIYLDNINNNKDLEYICKNKGVKYYNLEKKEYENGNLIIKIAINLKINNENYKYDLIFKSLLKKYFIF